MSGWMDGRSQPPTPRSIVVVVDLLCAALSFPPFPILVALDDVGDLIGHLLHCKVLSEELFELPSLAHQVLNDRVVHKVVLLVSADAFIVVDPESLRYVLDLCGRPRQTNQARVELPAVSVHLRACVAARVDRDIDRLHDLAKLGIELLDDGRLFLQFLRADVGAKGETEVDELVFAPEVAVRHDAALTVVQSPRTTQFRLADFRLLHLDSSARHDPLPLKQEDRHTTSRHGRQKQSALPCEHDIFFEWWVLGRLWVGLTQLLARWLPHIVTHTGRCQQRR
mmetsp:Transcript_45163/g.112180  ORF Transcript_45163/g.112180 Transcript_45163/m.112180 type:complete len:281 (-) Transcript_45163:115-957(-)